jgi:tetratricopeptide (TPR) repeat protein
MHQAIEYDGQQTYELYYDYAKLLEQLGENQEAQKLFQVAKEINKKNETQHP